MPKRMSRTEWQRFLGGRRVAVLATIGDNGEPVLTPIWYLYRAGLVYMRTGARSVKAANIRRDPRVTLCIQDEQAPYRSVTVYGHASMIEEAEHGLGEAIARRYLGAIAGAAYVRTAREAVEQSAEITLVVHPEQAIIEPVAQQLLRAGQVAGAHSLEGRGDLSLLTGGQEAVQLHRFSPFNRLSQVPVDRAVREAAFCGDLLD